MAATRHERAPADADPALRSDNSGAWSAKLVVIAALMFGFGYALVPMYRAICTALGINVLSVAERRCRQRAAGGNTQVDTSRVITVEFDANARGPWSSPAQRSVDVHPGEMATVMYEFQNVQDRTMSAQAIPSYAPRQAMAHFNKLECFCFKRVHAQARANQAVAGGVRHRPETLPRDVRTITLLVHLLRGGRQDARGAEHMSDGLKDARCSAGARSCRRCAAVAWSFFGVRKSRDYEQDVASSTRCT